MSATAASKVVFIERQIVGRFRKTPTHNWVGARQVSTVIALRGNFRQKKAMQSGATVSPESPASSGGRLLMVGWMLAAVTLALSLTGFLGFGIWLLPWPVAIAILVLALKRGVKGQGIALL